MKAFENSEFEKYKAEAGENGEKLPHIKNMLKKRKTIPDRNGMSWLKE